MRLHAILVSCVSMLLVPALGAAQDRVIINIDAAQQTTTTTLTSTTTFTEFVEEGQVTTTATVQKGLVYGGGLTFRTWKSLVMGAAVSYYAKDAAAQVDAQLPHPFLFNQPRLVSVEVPGLRHTETGTHIIIGVMVPATDRVDIVLTAGPSIFQVQQDLASRVTYTHTYPYDEVQFTGVTTVRASDTAIGYHVGADVTLKFSQHVGVGGLLRFSRAKVETTVDGDPVSFDAGGLYAGGGLRFIF